MKITIEHHHGDRPSFNVSLASKEGAQPFLTVKGVRIVDGSKGQFISWPATKNAKTDKYWQHVWCSEAFNTAVLNEARKEAPDTRTIAERRPKPPVADDDAPW
jgi:DNA-binding cell septation regulator SpoVG